MAVRTMTNPPPHGLPRELKMAGKDENGFIFLGDHMIPITRTFDDDGKLRLKVGPCDPVARHQLDDWLAWASTVTPKGTTP